MLSEWLYNSALLELAVFDCLVSSTFATDISCSCNCGRFRLSAIADLHTDWSWLQGILQVLSVAEHLSWPVSPAF